MSSDKNISYIQTRLDSLHEIDSRVVSLLDNLSSTLTDLKTGKQTGNRVATTASFKDDVGKFYENLSYAGVKLRQEIEILDNKINSQLKEINLLPIQINKKATWVNGYKLNEEVGELDKVLKLSDQPQPSTTTAMPQPSKYEDEDDKVPVEPVIKQESPITTNSEVKQEGGAEHTPMQELVDQPGGTVSTGDPVVADMDDLGLDLDDLNDVDMVDM